MKIELSSRPAGEIPADAVALVVFEPEDSRSPSPEADRLSGGLVSELYAEGGLKTKLLEITLIHRPAAAAAKRLLAVGGGKRGEFDPARLRRAAAAAARALKDKGVKSLAVAPPGVSDAAGEVEAVVEGVTLAGYEPDVYKTEGRSTGRIEKLTVLADSGLARSLERGREIAEAQNFARALVNEPGNRLPPRLLAERALEMARAERLDAEILDRGKIEELKMGALLGVAQGSDEPPVLILVRYRPAEASSDIHLGLVGKGVTFDTGGISIKPSEDMDRMKYDMAGAAAMLGAMKAIARLKPSVAVTAVIPSVENMPGSRAQRPGDVVTTMSGKTVEVLNTDAEGRLILADALTYAQRLGCNRLVDAATLTGSIVVALGHERVGLFSNDDSFRDRFLEAAETAGEKMWPMPLDEEYKEQLESPIADLPNIGARWGGAVTAAMFLKQFADPAAWVHLDIAGTAWLDKAKPDMPKGPTGVAVRTLVELAASFK